MIKVVYCITRRSDLTRDEFCRYFRHAHGPIAKRIPGVRRLVQSHAVAPEDAKAGAKGADYDGMAELWFDDWSALEAARRSQAWRESSEDEAHFIDHKHVAYFVAEEHEIVKPDA